MKVFFAPPVKVIAVLFFGMFFLFACKNNEAPAAGAVDKDTSYAFGMLMAGQMGQMGLSRMHFDYNSFMEGFRDFNEARETRLSGEDADMKITALFQQLEMQAAEAGETNRVDGEAYLAQNGARSGVTTTASGLQYEVITEGSGAKPSPEDTVQVQYEGTLIDGTVFDSSYARGTPAEFLVSGVIPGWSEGVQLMNEGSKYRFVIPSGLAYGERGAAGGVIPPNATLIFEVELLSIVR